MPSTKMWKDVDGTRTFYLYADEGLVAEYDDSGNEIRSYGYRPDSTWTTDPLWLKEGVEYYWYQNDHLGMPQTLIDMNGTVVWAATYTAFGEAQIQVAIITNNLRFPGQYYDAETGLHYNFQRYYDSEIGRYLRVDPIGFAGGDVNLYVYVWNNPINWVDPLGLELLICSRRTRHPVLRRLGTIHAYLYDSSDPGRYMGMGDSIEDPTQDACNIVGDPGPEEIDKIFDYLKKRNTVGVRFPIVENWKPVVNDCQTVIEDTLKYYNYPEPGLPNPGIPGGRWGDAGLKGVWILELEILHFIEEQQQRMYDQAGETCPETAPCDDSSDQ